MYLLETWKPWAVGVLFRSTAVPLCSRFLEFTLSVLAFAVCLEV